LHYEDISIDNSKKTSLCETCQVKQYWREIVADQRISNIYPLRVECKNRAIDNAVKIDSHIKNLLTGCPATKVYKLINSIKDIGRYGG